MNEKGDDTLKALALAGTVQDISRDVQLWLHGEMDALDFAERTADRIVDLNARWERILEAPTP